MKKEKKLVGFCWIILWILLVILLMGCEKTAEQEVVIETKEIEKEDAADEPEEETEVIYIHVCGAVKNPGVYELPFGSRVTHALEAAGGVTKDASEESINQARILTDGEQLQIKTKEEAASVSAAETTKEEKININTADQSALMSLNGIGEAKAQAILDYREAHGMFQCVEDICNVDGIGKSIFSKIQDKITVN